ncbi:MAG: ribonuclease HI [Gammaproteobacteria bacterium]|nr:ribonuclease HI [Gammaproteobacteria bacterium]
MTDCIEIFTDGACRGNPGPGGWAALLRYRQAEKSIRGAEAHTTNNRMELTAAIEGLAALKRPSRVTLTTDSEYVRQGITRWVVGWKRRGWMRAGNRPVLNVDLWRRLDSLNEDHEVSWRWVKGHSGHAENEAVDRAANQAIDEMLAKDDPRTDGAHEPDSEP